MKSRNTKTSKERACDDGSKKCSACAGCRAVDNEQIASAWNQNSAQLYAKEAENYFFYYRSENEAVKF